MSRRLPAARRGCHDEHKGVEQDEQHDEPIERKLARYGQRTAAAVLPASASNDRSNHGERSIAMHCFRAGSSRPRQPYTVSANGPSPSSLLLKRRGLSLSPRCFAT